MSAKEWRKFFFSDEKILNLNGLAGFQKYWHAKNFLEENYSTRHSRGGSVKIWGSFLSSGKLKVQYVSGRQKSADYVKMPNDLSLAQEEHRLFGKEWIFQQDNAANHYASITKYFLEQKMRLLYHPVCSPDINPIENLLQKFMKERDSNLQFMNSKTQS